MCTLVILRRPGHDWPVVIAANRDEMIDRAWRGPGRHWPDRAHVTAGQDELAGGSWLGVNDDGLCAGILNRTGALGPATGKRSRGELVLDALDHADAAAAAMALADIDGAAYRPFNLVVADSDEAFWLRHDGGKAPVFHALPEGLSMFTARERNDAKSARIRTHLEDFEAAAPPDPERGAWDDWAALLARGGARLGRRPGGCHVHRARRRIRDGQRLADRAPASWPARHRLCVAFRGRGHRIVIHLKRLSFRVPSRRTDPRGPPGTADNRQLYWPPVLTMLAR